MNNLPAWVEKAKAKASWVSENEMRLCEALSIAWEVLAHQKASGQLEIAWYKWRAEEAMRRIESLGGSKWKIEKTANPEPRYISEEDI